MLARLRRCLHDPAFLVAIAAGLIAFVVQSGDVDSADTVRRLQTTHSFWTSAPPVLSGDYPEFGLRGRGGTIYAWYGMGQSLLMLPADIVGTCLERLPIFEDYNGNDPSIRNIIVSYSTNILINVLTALVCLRFLLLLGFDMTQAVGGVLGLLLCTTHLHYTQNMMENNYIMLLTLAGFCFQYEWVRTGSHRALLMGSAAFGLNLLTRLTVAMDLIAGGVFILLLLYFDNAREQNFWKRTFTYIRTAAPVYLFFILIDRWYQYYRFGSFTNTYVALFAREQRNLRPNLPPNYPFETPFHEGFFGALFTPEKSIFLFDPLLILCILVVLFGWKHYRKEVRAFLISAGGLLLSYVCFYARYTVWSGDSAWGDRYVSTAVEFVAFLTVPLWMRYRSELGSWLSVVAVILIAASAAVQVASVVFWLPLELYQMTTLGHPTFVVGLRFKNIVAFALGKMTQWGLTNADMTTDPWDYVHITTWNFLPFVLRRVGAAPRWVVLVTLYLWQSGLVLLFCTLWQMRRTLTGNALRPGTSNP